MYFFFEHANADGNMIYVADNGTADFTKIQDAINASYEGDTVYVYRGTYYESLTINKSINLIGEDNSDTIIDSKDMGNAINIKNTNNVTIKNLEITADEKILSQDEQGTASNPYCGIKLENVAHSTIDNCNISNCASYGITFAFIFDIHSNNITIKNNIIKNNSYGIKISKGDNNLIINNNISYNNDNGIYISTSNNVVINNTFFSNRQDGISIPWSSREIKNNIIFNNRFINNSFKWFDQNNARDGSGPNYWYSIDLKQGNYWDDHNRTDINEDGIGDIPYDIPNGDNQDLYPIMDIDSDKLVYIPGDYNINIDNGNTNDNENKDKENDNSIPGFEILLLMIGVVFVLIFSRKKQI